MSNPVRIAIVGSGPSGLSCASHAAELDVPHVLLEAEEHPSHTIFRYQKGKHVMAEPGILPLRSPMSFAAGKREAVLAKWNEEIAKYKVNIRNGAAVTSISGSKGAFELKTAAGDTYLAEHVVLCIGLQGNIRKLGVPGEDLERVQYQLDDPAEYNGETIIVVGAGDAGIENALALTENNRVILINRVDEFPRVKQGNVDLVTAAIRDGKMECRYSTSAVKVEAVETDGRPLCFTAQTPQGVENIACNRVIARLGAIPPRKLVESFGVQFPNQTMEAVPQVSATYESNVPGLYIIGALGGYPLIKQAMNQGYEVVEYILGNPVEPADEFLLQAKFKNFKRAKNVSEALALVQTNVPLFKDLTTLQLREFMLDSEVPRAQAAASSIFRKGDYTNSFFSIVDGDVMIEVTDDPERPRNVALKRGEFFGELGLLVRTAPLEHGAAGDNCVLIETPRRSMLKLIASIESVRRQIDETSLRRAVRAQVAPSMSEADLDAMVKDATIKSFAAGQSHLQGRRRGGRPASHPARLGDDFADARRQGGRAVVCRRGQLRGRNGAACLRARAARQPCARRSTAKRSCSTAKTFNEVLGRNPDLARRNRERASWSGCRRTCSAKRSPIRAT